jgi:hypothetical protein
MRNMIRRVVKLEQAYCVGSAQVPPQVIRVTYVAPDGEVTDGYDVVIGQPDSGPDLSKPRRMNRTDR